MKLVAAAAFVALGTAGCGAQMEVHHAMLRTAPPEPRPALLYMEGHAPPPGAFYELGFVQAVGFGGDASPEEVARALTEEAGRQGCQAVVRANIDMGSMRGHASGVCVRFVDAPDETTR